MFAIQILMLAAPAATPAPQSVQLTFKAHREWELLLPEERFEAVGDAIPFPHLSSGGFAAELRGTSLWLDRDGDGVLEVEVEASEDPEESKLVVLSATAAGGQALSYAVRLKNNGRWSWATSGTMVGSFQGTRVQLVDQNGNGRYDDFGEDALVIGRSSAASYLSRVVNLGGELFSLDVQADGTQVELTPYQGESGALDMQSGFESDARLRAVVVESVGGELSFELARSKGGMRVPAGEYRLHSGEVVLGKGRARLRAGRSESISVAPDETLELAWGGPVEAEVVAARQGGQLVFVPQEIYYYGEAGEEYSNFMPLGSSPEFALLDANTGEELVNVKFPGNC